MACGAGVEDFVSSSGLNRSVWVAAAIAATAFALGVFGYLEAGAVSLASAVHNTLGLFTLTFTMPPGTSESSLPVALEYANRPREPPSCVRRCRQEGQARASAALRRQTLGVFAPV